MELPILEQGTVVGVCHWAQEGLHIRFLCRLPGRHTVCKLWLERQGTKTLLGTPAPGEDGLLLRRTLSQRALEHGGSFPPEHILCTGEEPTAGYRTQGVPGGDDFLRCLFGQGGWSWKPTEAGLEMCHPWPDHTPFPAPALFCFCRVTRGPWGRCVTLRLDADGMPVLWD